VRGRITSEVSQGDVGLSRVIMLQAAKNEF
jgi:hypothetical protein